MNDSVANVPESWVWLRADFQSGSRVLKKVSWTFSYLYLWHTMWFHAKKLLKTLIFWKSLIRYVNLAPKNGSLNCDLLKFLNRYGIFWVPPGESSCPDGSEYVWQRGVESLQGRVTAARSWPLFREKKNHLRRCYKKLLGHNSDHRAKSSWEEVWNVHKKILRERILP